MPTGPTVRDFVKCFYVEDPMMIEALINKWLESARENDKLVDFYLEHLVQDRTNDHWVAFVHYETTNKGPLY